MQLKCSGLIYKDNTKIRDGLGFNLEINLLHDYFFTFNLMYLLANFFLIMRIIIILLNKD